MWLIPQHNDELEYKPSSIATFQGSFTMKIPKRNKRFRSPTLDFYFIGIITIEVDCCMLINKLMSYYSNKII